MGKNGLFAALSLLILLVNGPALAEKIIWIDEKGGIHSEVREPDESDSPQVELYVTSWCPSCKHAIKFLRSRGIPFKVYDIEKDRSAAKRKKALDNGKSVPFAVINGEKIVGFSPAAYERALKGGR